MKGKSDITCASWLSKHTETKYALLRIVVGLMFFFHGASKFGIIGDGAISGFAGMVGGQLWLAVLVGLAETVGGLFILFGFFTRYAALVDAAVMVGAWALAHIPRGWYPLTNGGELALVYFFTLLFIASKGPGKWSLDKKWFEK